VKKLTLLCLAFDSFTIGYAAGLVNNSTVSSQIVYLCRNRQASQLVLWWIYFQNGEETCRGSFVYGAWYLKKLLALSTCCRRTTQHLSWLPTKYPAQDFTKCMDLKNWTAVFEIFYATNNELGNLLLMFLHRN